MTRWIREDEERRKGFAFLGKSQLAAVPVLMRRMALPFNAYCRIAMVRRVSETRSRGDRRKDGDAGAEHAASPPTKLVKVFALIRGEQTEEPHTTRILNHLPVPRTFDITPLACLHHVPVRACSPARSRRFSTHVSIAPGPLREQQPASLPDSMYELPVTGIPLEDGSPPLRQMQPQSHHPLARREM